MKIRTVEKIFALTGQEIEDYLALLEEQLTAIHTEKQNRLRLRLSLEEALLRLRDRFGETQAVKALFKKHFNRLLIQLDAEGEPCNPLRDEEYEMEDMCGSLLTAVGISPQYVYDGRRNTLRLQLPLPGMGPLVKLMIALLGGTALGLAGLYLLSDKALDAAIQTAVMPSMTIWRRILNVLSGPVIFFMTLTSVLNMGKITENGGNARRIVSRYFMISFQMAIISLAIAGGIFGMSVDGFYNADASVSFWDRVVQMIPKDFFSPFMESNTVQLLILAAVIGEALNMIGSHTRNLCRIIRQINMVGLQLCEWISRMLPYVTAVMLGMGIWQRTTTLLVGFVICLVLAVAISVLCIGMTLIYICRKKKLRIRQLFSKLWEPFWLALKGGSLNASYGKLEQSCAADLGIQRSFLNSSLTNGMTLCMPVSSVGTMVLLAYFAVQYGTETSLIWHIGAILLSAVLFVATPPVPGANLLAYVVTFAWLGIPGEVLIDAMLFDITFGYFANAGNQMVLEMELILQADHIGMLDRKRLMAPIKRQSAGY